MLIHLDLKIPHNQYWLWGIDCGLVTPYGDVDLVNIGSGNGLVLSGTKPLPEAMLTTVNSLI